MLFSGLLLRNNLSLMQVTTIEGTSILLVFSSVSVLKDGKTMNWSVNLEVSYFLVYLEWVFAKESSIF